MWIEVRRLVVLINAPTFQRRNLIASVAVLVCVRRYTLEYGPVNHAAPRFVSTVLIGMAPVWRGIVSVGGGNQLGRVDSYRRRRHASVRGIIVLRLMARSQGVIHQRPEPASDCWSVYASL
jgi:hypothetical protein